MKAADLRELPEAELLEQLAEHKQELFALRFQSVTGQLDDASRVSKVKREIARILTILRERELAAELEEAAR
jgi:large subunit ribosomal protein L29